MPEVKFYVATMADAVSRAVRISPNKGPAYDRAHGVMLTINPEGTAEVRSTDLQISYRERINDIVSVDVDEVIHWRLPAQLLNGILQSFPVESECTMHMDDGGSVIHFSCGRKKAKLILQGDPDLFPDFPEFPVDGFGPVRDFGTQLRKTAWAVDKEAVPFSGVHFDGEYIVATDRYKLCVMPLKVPVQEPITVPLATLSYVLSNLPGEASVQTNESGMLIKVGEEIDVVAAKYEAMYPNWRPILEMDDWEYSVTVPREEIENIISNMMVLVKSERYPRVRITLDDNEMRVAMNVPQVGEMEDVISVQWQHDPLTIDFTPDYLTKAFAASDDPKIVWELSANPKKITHIKDSTDYQAWVMPRNPTQDPKE